MSWIVAHDVTEGREDLDFSAWTTLRPQRRAKLLREIADETASRDMPPALYRLGHPEARLDDSARAALSRWARDSAAAMETSAGMPP